jgi:hypothetical protein
MCDSQGICVVKNWLNIADGGGRTYAGMPNVRVSMTISQSTNAKIKTRIERSVYLCLINLAGMRATILTQHGVAIYHIYTLLEVLAQRRALLTYLSIHHYSVRNAPIRMHVQN